MFEFDSSRTLRAEENERKPNVYSAAALRVGLIILVACLLLNEIGMFHLNKNMMRVCAAFGALCCVIPQVIAGNEKLAADHRSKYVVLGCTCLMCFGLNLCLFIFAAPLAMMPMLLAVQYNSQRMSKWAILGAGVSAALAPPLGCAMGFWDSEFLRFLLSCALGGEVRAVATNQAGGLINAGWLGVIVFVSLPWLMTVVMLSKLILSATRKGEDNIQDRIKLIHMSRLDALTGLYNQNVYDQYLKSPVRGDESVGIFFFDVDGLKRTNDQKGHEWGDLLLRRCAESLQAIFDDNCHGFRIGGDEFLVVVDTEDPKVVEDKLEQWRQSMERVNLENRTRHPGLFCHMSVGTSFGAKYDLSALIVKADKRMYRDKEAYHKSVGLETAR